MADLNILAYGEITILDLIDTATYIYYAEDENGTGAKTAPDANSKYIGIYSGPPFEGFPSKFPMDNWKEEEWSGWTSYIGPQGNGIESIDYRYYVTYENLLDHPDANLNGWVNTMPSIKAGQYLWLEETITFSNREKQTSYRPSYSGTNGEDGEDALSYTPNSNRDSIYRFSTKNGITYSLEQGQFLEVWLTDSTDTNLDITTYTPSFSVLLPGGEQDSGGIEDITKYFDDADIFGTSSPLIVNTSNNVYQFSLYNFLNNSKVDLDASDGTALVKSYRDLVTNFNNVQGILIKFYDTTEEKNFMATLNITVEWGTSEDMAKFAITSNTIQGWIDDSKMTFSADGLKISNGNFQIVSSDELGVETSLFSYDGKALYVEGNGTFTGKIVANEGEFTGEVTAESGFIGGFIIEQGRLVSSDTINVGENHAIELNGENGSIIAKNIELGEGAIITNYINLGNKVQLLNPDKNDGYFIKVLNEDKSKNIISISDDGVANFGNIEIDGANSIIDISQGQSIIKGSGWSLTPEAGYFENIVIENGVFETGNIQTLGGAMIFKPSSSYTVEDGKIKLDHTIDALSAGAYVIFSNSSTGAKTEELVEITSLEDDGTITLDLEINISDYDVITYYCRKSGDDLFDRLLIGINSQNGFKDGIVSNLPPKSISFTEMILNENKKPIFKDTPSLILGDLSSLNELKIGGYGLYGENVFLNGTLTTKVDGGDSNKTSYAGVNTLSGVEATKFEEYGILDSNKNIDTSRIVFWGGATNNTESAIQNANFQVTENGSIYANQGVFEGTLITKSTIEGSEIRAAKLRGWSITNEDGTLIREEAPLVIYNTNENIGIQFREEFIDQSSGKTKDYLTLDLKSTGFTVYNKADSPSSKQFITFKDGNQSSGEEPKVYGNFDFIQTDELSTGDILSEDDTWGAFIEFNETNAVFNVQDSKVFEITKSEAVVEKNLQAKETIIYGSGIMEYQKQLNESGEEIGYDLYIS